MVCFNCVKVRQVRRCSENRGMAEEDDDIIPISPIDSVSRTLKNLLSDNISHFRGDDSELGQRLYNGLYALQDGLDHLLTQCEPLRKICANYDLSPEEPGNGIRSIVNMSHAAIMNVFELLKQISTGRGTILFYKKHYVKEVESWSQAMASLGTLLDYLNSVVIPHCVDGELLPNIETTSEELFSLSNTVSQYAFYGRCNSFQYCESMQKVFKVLNIGICAFSEVYYSDGGIMQRTKQSLMTGSKYMLNPETRARRLVDVVQYCSVDFIKAFWALADLEIIAKLNTYVGYNTTVEERIIVPCEDMEILSIDGRLLVVQAPNSSVLPNPITCYLLSANIREGMHSSNVAKSTNILPKSDVVIFHCHGGGYISQSTKVQGVFLKEWAVKTDVPIFSVDYSLSPYAKYPRALEEILTSYVWMLNNFSRLGTTGKKIILTGDSAGGNMLTAMTVKCFELGIRAADAMLLIYTPQTLQINPCASRLLQILDPLLPLGFAVKCLKAYAYLPPVTPDSQKLSESNDSTKSRNGTKAKDSYVTEEKIDLLSSNERESFVELNESDLKTESDKDIDTMTTVSLSSIVNTKENAPKTLNGKELEMTKDRTERSRKYVTEFLDKYVLDTRVDRDGHSIPILRNLSDAEEEECSPVQVLSDKLGKARDAVLGSVSAGISSLGIAINNEMPKVESTTASVEKKSNNRPYLGKINLGTSSLKGDDSNTLIKEFIGVNIHNDYYVNPYQSPRDILAKFPPTFFLTSEFDFALDDSVMMAKLLRSLGVKTKLKVLPQLPHGFLNLTMVSKEAHDGNKSAINMLQEIILLFETAS